MLVADCTVHAFALARFYSLDRETQGRGSHWYVIAQRGCDRSRLSTGFQWLCERLRHYDPTTERVGLLNRMPVGDQLGTNDASVTSDTRDDAAKRVVSASPRAWLTPI